MTLFYRTTGIEVRKTGRLFCDDRIEKIYLVISPGHEGKFVLAFW